MVMLDVLSLMVLICALSLMVLILVLSLMVLIFVRSLTVSMHEATLITRLQVSIQKEACRTPSCVPRSIVQHVWSWPSECYIKADVHVSIQSVVWQVLGNAGYSMMFQLRLQEVCISEPTA